MLLSGCESRVSDSTGKINRPHTLSALRSTIFQPPNIPRVLVEQFLPIHIDQPLPVPPEHPADDLRYRNTDTLIVALDTPLAPYDSIEQVVPRSRFPT